MIFLKQILCNVLSFLFFLSFFPVLFCVLLLVVLVHRLSIVS